jgi:MarR family transcriptional regulator for hemolysin
MHIYQNYSSADSAGHLIYRLSRLLRQAAINFFRDQAVALTPEQWGLLLNLAENQGCLQSQLADGVLKDFPNVTKMLDGLQKQGLAERRPDPDDRRRHAVYLTQAGEDLVDRLLPEIVEQKEEIFAGLNRAELEELVKSLKKVEQNLIGHLR